MSSSSLWPALHEFLPGDRQVFFLGQDLRVFSAACDIPLPGAPAVRKARSGATTGAMTG
jgi:hypothetical protein